MLGWCLLACHSVPCNFCVLHLTYGVCWVGGSWIGWVVRGLSSVSPCYFLCAASHVHPPSSTPLTPHLNPTNTKPSSCLCIPFLFVRARQSHRKPDPPLQHTPPKKSVQHSFALRPPPCHLAVVLHRCRKLLFCSKCVQDYSPNQCLPTSR